MLQDLKLLLNRYLDPLKDENFMSQAEVGNHLFHMEILVLSGRKCRLGFLCPFPLPTPLLFVFVPTLPTVTFKYHTCLKYYFFLS
jgi:hypothetical protein